MGLAEFEKTTPTFLPEEFFLGRLEGWGVLESLVGGLQKRCTISAEGRWDAGAQKIYFTETYRFDDGRLDIINWAIRKLGPGKYAGSEPTLVGEAAGEQAGCAFHWRYTRDTPQGACKTVRLNFDDWFYRIDERACMARGSAGRAGIPFVTAHVAYHRLTC